VAASVLGDVATAGGVVVAALTPVLGATVVGAAVTGALVVGGAVAGVVPGVVGATVVGGVDAAKVMLATPLSLASSP